MSESDDDRFVSRWSRLKRSQAEEPPLPEAPIQEETPPVAVEAESAPGGDAPDSEEIVRNLPDIETLTKDSDFTAFLQDGVPEELRNRALRHLWRLSPVFANLDGLNDYDLDYTDAAVAVKGVLKTLYQVGKGMPDPVKPEEELEDAVAEDSESAAAEPQDPTDDGKVTDPAATEEAGEGKVETAALADDTGESVLPDLLDDRRANGAPAVLSPRGSAAQRRWGRFDS